MAKTAVITGSTSGIGLELAVILAKSGFMVLGVGRNAERCEEARRRCVGESGNEQVRFFTADLSVAAQTRRLADEITCYLERPGRRSRTNTQEVQPEGVLRGSLDCLINNAGTFSSRRRTSADGIEITMAVNHVAPFTLTRALLPVLRNSTDPRIVNVSSGSHYSGRISPADPLRHHGFAGLPAYSASKLASVLFSYELARREPWLTVYAADPGLVNTDMGFKETGPLARIVWRLRKRGGVPPAESAAHIAFLVTGESVYKKTGRYWKERQPIESSRASFDSMLARRLWEETEKAIAI